MTATTLTLTTRIVRPDDEVAAYLARPSAAARLTPPWFPPDVHFDDRHITTHIDPDGQSACLLTEEFHTQSYLAPAAALRYRHATLRDDLEHTAPYGHVRPLRIAIAGASGLIGRALTTFLQTQNHEVIPLPRISECGMRSVKLHSTDAVINLAGAPMFTPPWTQPRRDEIWRSRADTTRALIAALANLNPRPFVYLNASSAAIYGAHADTPLDETAPPAPHGAGFLSDVCAGWEHEALAAGQQPGIRTVLLRFARVLTPAGGYLHALLPQKQNAHARQLGHGRQWTSWITIDDAIASIYHAILTHAYAGPVNLSSPTPLTNADFTAALARVLHKKTLPAIPRWMLRLRYGIDFANETLLASQRMVPAKLQATGYTFRHPAIETALTHLLP